MRLQTNMSPLKPDHLPTLPIRTGPSSNHDANSERTDASAQPSPLSPGKDLNVQFELEIEEDFFEELESFTRLKKLGRFQEASSLFEEALVKHCNFFPVLVEYADLLLEQGRYDYILGYTDEEGYLLRLFEAVARMYSQGALEGALEEAREAWDFLDIRNHDPNSGFNEVEVRNAARSNYSDHIELTLLDTHN